MYNGRAISIAGSVRTISGTVKTTQKIEVHIHGADQTNSLRSDVAYFSVRCPEEALWPFTTAVEMLLGAVVILLTLALLATYAIDSFFQCVEELQTRARNKSHGSSHMYCDISSVQHGSTRIFSLFLIV